MIVFRYADHRWGKRDRGDASSAQVYRLRDGQIVRCDYYNDSEAKPSKPWGWRSRRCRRRTWTCVRRINDAYESGRNERDAISRVLPPDVEFMPLRPRPRAHITGSRASKSSSRTAERSRSSSPTRTISRPAATACWPGARSVVAGRHSGIDDRLRSSMWSTSETGRSCAGSP